MSHGQEATETKIELKHITTNPGFGIGARDPKPKYVKHEDKPDEAKGVNDLREKAQLKDKPTTADAKKGLKDLPAIVSQVGNAAAFLQNMYSQVGMVSALMAGSSQSSRTETIENSLTGALSILANRWTYSRVIDVFDEALAGEKINLIDEVYRDKVKNALAKLYLKALEYGEENIPVSTYSTVTEIGEAPGTVELYPPDSYLQQYYPIAEDPYPGYIRWDSPNGDTFVFTVRKLGDKYYSSPQEEVYSISEQELAEKLDPYIQESNLTASDLNLMMREQETNIENNTDEKTVGKGSGGPNAQAVASQILGYIGTINKLQQSLQLPISVLSQGKVKETLGKFEKQMTKLKTMKKMLKMASAPPQAAALVGQLAGLAGGAGLSQISSLASAAGLSQVSGAINSVTSTVSQVSSLAGSAGVSLPKIPTILQ